MAGEIIYNLPVFTRKNESCDGAYQETDTTYGCPDCGKPMARKTSFNRRTFFCVECRRGLFQECKDYIIKIADRAPF